MDLKPPLTQLDIPTTDGGFYDGFTRTVAVSGKIIIGALIFWAVAFPQNAGNLLNAINEAILATFNYWYVWTSAFFVVLCLLLALIPASRRMRLGEPEDRPEFTNFSWFSMMFGAGVGVGMLTYSTGEPISHFQTNPAVIQGLIAGSSAETVRPAYEWSFLHWGLTPWACYALTGLALAYFSYRRGLPLTIRSGLTSLFGSRLEGPLGHVVDIVAVVATVLGVSQTLGYGVEQFVAGVARVSGGAWLLNDDSTASAAAVITALVVIVGASTLSAMSGVGRGIKWLSNINTGLSIFVLLFFLIFGATLFSLQALFVGIWDYLTTLPWKLTTVWSADGTESGNELAAWQGSWTIFYWAWWIAFAPFVGLFLARISKGRTIREYILGAMIVPSAVCFTWFALVGGTAISLELTGQAQGAIVGTGLSDQLYATLAVMLPAGLATLMSAVVVVLLLTYLVTSVDSAVLIINTINAAGDEGPKARPHILFWGVALALVVGALLIVGGLSAIQTAMIVGALPFSFVMMLMGLSLVKAIIMDNLRKQADVPRTVGTIN